MIRIPEAESLVGNVAVAEQFERHIAYEPMSGCWLWTGSTRRRGYGQMSHKGRLTGAHRIAYRLTKGTIPGGMYVLHKCDIPACCNPDHLFVGTPRANVDDMLKKGRQLRGMRKPGAKLARRDVLYIRSSAEKCTILGERFGVHPTTIGKIRSRKKWKHVK